MAKSISTAQLKNFKNLLEKRNDHRVLERTVTQNGILASSCDYRAKVNTTPVFSIDLDTGKVADQKRSGRCWMFAALNTLRHDLRNRLNLPDEFELSQTLHSSGINSRKQIIFMKTSYKQLTSQLLTGKFHGC